MLFSRTENRLAVGPSDIAGRGVFATEDIGRGEIMEECQIIRVPAEQLRHLDQTVVYEYYLEWEGDGAIVLGLGSLYNHCSEPSAEHVKDIRHNRVLIRAIRDIHSGEEITVNYSARAYLTEGP